ncbi:MAG TPA: BatA domain-containing protein, partial [Gemmatimonadales bacterium]|nr:BatA domain-containing protein [Gemmatimonadales bacterium]
MFGPVAFVAPAWLAALAALAVPLALHLWARRPGRVVRVGSLRGLEAAPARARALRLTDPWLLLLRLLLLAALVLALAGPYRAGAGRGRPVTWALVDPALPGDPTARAALAPLLDSLRRTGTPLRLLAPGLPALDATDTTATPAAADAWAVLREADAQLAPGSRIVVLAPDGFTRVSGERPRLRAAVEWRALPGRAAGRSTDAAADRRDTLPLGALLVADAAHAEDARYVGAALRAAAGVSGRAIAVTTAAPDDPAATGAAARPAEWIVWLAARPVPPALRARVRAGARLLTTGDTGLDSTSAGALVPWPGAADAPPLEERVAGAGRCYRFAGRFHPD